jgi:predicted transcriptional regulator
MTALRRGEMSVGRFAEYVGISRQEAMRYAEQEQDGDEEIELPAA